MYGAMIVPYCANAAAVIADRFHGSVSSTTSAPARAALSAARSTPAITAAATGASPGDGTTPTRSPFSERRAASSSRSPSTLAQSPGW